MAAACHHRTPNIKIFHDDSGSLSEERKGLVQETAMFPSTTKRIPIIRNDGEVQSTTSASGNVQSPEQYESACHLASHLDDTQQFVEVSRSEPDAKRSA